ncbi:MAG: DUF4339 domain-containing protein [Lentisphaerae bacterium]|nr:DUF4339 domain-containing protein [Lentisphaerota bacterium]
MMEKHITPPRANDEFGIWFLRVDDNQIRGPVSLSTLRQWAESGTLGAGDLISPDAKSWQPAATVQGLEMEWLADLDNGESYGPFNIKAIRQLVERGILRPDSVLHRRSESTRLDTGSGTEPAPLTTVSPRQGTHATKPADERVVNLERELRDLRAQLAGVQRVHLAPSHTGPDRRALTDTGNQGTAAIDRLYDKVQHTEDMLQRLLQAEEQVNAQESSAERNLPTASPAAHRATAWQANSRPGMVRRRPLVMESDDDMEWELPANPRELARTRRFRAQTLRWNVINSSLVIGTGVTVGAVGIMLGVEPVQYTGVVLSFLGIVYFGVAMLLLLTRKLSNWGHLSVIKESAPSEEGHPLRGAMNISIYWFNRKFRAPPRD